MRLLQFFDTRFLATSSLFVVGRWSQRPAFGRRYSNQEFHQVVEFRVGQSRGIARGHNRLRQDFDRRYVGFRKHVETPIPALQLNREVVLVSNDSRNRLRILQLHTSHSGTPARALNIASDFPRRYNSVAREIASQKSAPALHHVAFRATRLSKEKRLPFCGVTGQSTRRITFALQEPEVRQHRVETRYPN